MDFTFLVRDLQYDSENMDIRFACPHCAQRIAVDESGVGLQIECPGCHSQVTVPAPVKPPARTLPRLMAQKPDETPPLELPDRPSDASKSGKKGKGAKYRCNNPRCGAVVSESQLLTQQVAGRMSQVCPKCRMNVTLIPTPPGFWSRMFKKGK
jgi:Zn finger protein HypA/HybF involved in hydrogenase expression